MIRVRIEFLNERDHQAILKVLNENFNVVECCDVKQSKQKGNKFKIQYLSMVPAHEE